MLTLPIKKKWFDMILSGEKKEEYREIKDYWTNRFCHYLRGTVVYNFDIIRSGYVIFKNGYSKDAPQIKCFVDCYKGYGREYWGAEPNKLYYVLKILSVERVESDVKLEN